MSSPAHEPIGDASEKLRLVLDYVPCEMCLSQPVKDQAILCSLCARLHRHVGVRVTLRTNVLVERPEVPEPEPVVIPPAEQAPAQAEAEPEPQPVEEAPAEPEAPPAPPPVEVVLHEGKRRSAREGRAVEIVVEPWAPAPPPYREVAEAPVALAASPPAPEPMPEPEDEFGASFGVEGAAPAAEEDEDEGWDDLASVTPAEPARDEAEESPFASVASQPEPARPEEAPPEDDFVFRPPAQDEAFAPPAAEPEPDVAWAPEEEIAVEPEEPSRNPWAPPEDEEGPVEEAPAEAPPEPEASPWARPAEEGDESLHAETVLEAGPEPEPEPEEEILETEVVEPEDEVVDMEVVEDEPAVEEEPVMEMEILEDDAEPASPAARAEAPPAMADAQASAPVSAAAPAGADSDLHRLRGFTPAHWTALASQRIEALSHLSGHDANDLARRTGLAPDLLVPWVNVADLVHEVGVPIDAAVAMVAAGVPGPRGLAEMDEQSIVDRVSAFGGATISARDVKRWKRRV